MSRHHRPLFATLRWKAVRKAVFARDGYRCVICGHAGRLECDHITPLKAGGDPFDMKNLRTLCRGCHIRITARQNRKPVKPEVKAWRQKLQNLVNEL